MLAAYHLNPGDTIMVDAGTYDLSNILTLGSNASGIIIEGYNGPNYPNITTVFNRGLLSSDVIDVNGAVNLTLENLTVTGGLIGINAIAYSGSTGLTIKNCTIYDNDSEGIQIGAGDNNAQVINNSLYGQLDLSAYIQQSMGIVLGNGNATTAGVTVSGNTIYDTSNTGIVVGGEVNGAMISSNRIFGSGTGISAVGSTVPSTITGNTVFDDNTGITGAGNLLISQNYVYEQSSVGLNLTNVTEAIGNTVYDSAEGITSSSYLTNLTANNTVYGNATAGIVLQGQSVARGNTVYGNATGIEANYESGATIQNNLIYDNSSQGILLYEDAGCTITNNTVYQPQGDAIDIDYLSTQEYLQNNILWTQAGYDINVAPTAESGLQSDYNDLYATGNGAIGLWEGQTFNSLASWILELNLDQHSISANPQFVNAAGPDGVLGFSAAQAGPFQSAGTESVTGPWTSYGNGGYTISAGNGSSSVTWTFTGLTSGATYLVSTGFQALSGAAGDAAFEVNDAGNVVLYQKANQSGNSIASPVQSIQIVPGTTSSLDTLNAVVSTNPTWPNGDPVVPSYTWLNNSDTTSSLNLSALAAPNVPGVLQAGVNVRTSDNGPKGGGGTFGGTAYFQELGYVTVAGTSVTVTLTNYANGPVVAGSVYLQQIVGNGGGDDDLHVSPGSPTIDAGNPALPVGLEPLPNGDRINLGSDGGTAQATISSGQLVQVLTPGNLNRLQQGQQTTITWQTNGIYAPSGYYSSAVLANDPLAYYPLGDTSGTTATDASGNGNNATYVGGVQLGTPGALPFDPGTSATLNGSTGYVQLPTITNDFTSGFSAEFWAYPTAQGPNNQEFFDLSNGAFSDSILLYRAGSSNNLNFAIYQNGLTAGQVVAPNAVSLNQWQYFAVTMDSKGDVTIYKNGQPIATGTTTVPRSGDVRTENYLGKNDLAAYGYTSYSGALQEAAFYTSALSAAQVAAHYAQRVYGTVNIDLLQNGSVVQNIASNVPDNGSFNWTVPANAPTGAGFAVRVTVNNQTQTSGASPSTLQIDAATTNYYVAANGSDSNSGTDPADAMASLSALLNAYPNLGSGDTVTIEPGAYTLVQPVVIGASHSGLVITGPTSGQPAVFNRNNSVSDVIDVAGATGVTIEYLSLTAGAIGVDLKDGTNSSNVTVSHCTVFGNDNDGIYIGAGDNSAQIIDNTVYGLTYSGNTTQNQTYGIAATNSNPGFSGAVTVMGNTVFDSRYYGIVFYVFGTGPNILDNQVYACGTGITVSTSTSGSANASTISGNTVFDNVTGINESGNVNITDNTVYGQSGTGISTSSFDELTGNIVHDNAIGVSSLLNDLGAPIADNTVYHNSNIGIEAQGLTPVIGNTVYANATGIALDDNSQGAVSNNLVYENSSAGVLVSGGLNVSITGNTVYQPSGDDIDIKSSSAGISLENNILWAQAGFDLNVDPSSEVGFHSDYNDLYTTGTGQLGSWQGQTILTQASWFYLLGQDQHSLTVNPGFVNAAGPDGILGFSTTPIGAARVIDDSSSSGFSTTGTWTQTTAAAADNGEYLLAAPGPGNDVATWSFTGLTKGATYAVAATWPSLSYSGAASAPFTVIDGSQVILLADESQINAPSGSGKPPWQTLGYFVSSGGALTVQLSNLASGNVAADAVMIQQVQGNGGGDDDFRLAAGSPAVDAGDPADTLGLEPTDSGGRVDLGAYGGTALATGSQGAQLSVLTPGPLDKLQIGQQENITWQTGSLYAPANYYSSAVLADNPIAYYPLGDTAGTTATDASGNGNNAAYVGGVQLGLSGALPFDSGTAVGLNGSTSYIQLPTITNDFTSGFSAEFWADPTAVSNNQEFFDLSNGAFSDSILLYRVGTTNNLAFQVYQGFSQGPQVVAQNAISLNQWQYFAVTMDSKGDVTIYKNGQPIATGTTSVPRSGIVRTENYLGKNDLAAYGYTSYSGALQEAAFYPSALSAARVAAHYAQRIYGTVNINLLQNGTFIQNIATGVPDSGSFLWTVPTTANLGSGYQVEVTASNGAEPSGLSQQQFLIANNGNNYYINPGSTAGAVYTTAPGSDANSGKDPADPMETLAALLQAYPLGPGDTVYVDTGDYTLLRNIGLDLLHSGVTIAGPATGTGAVLSRGDLNTGDDDFQMEGGTNVTLSHLTITGAYAGVYGSSTADSTGLTVSDSTIYGNADYGVFLDTSNDDATFTGNTLYGDLAANGTKQPNGIYLNTDSNTITNNIVFDHSGDGIRDLDQGSNGGIMISGNVVYGNATGITVTTEATTTATNTISNNIVRNNTSIGIFSENDVVSGNTVYGQSAGGAIGISVSGSADGGVVLKNVLYGNYIGIESGFVGEPILDNRLYNNSDVGIYAEGGSAVAGNDAYSNNIGIYLTYNYNGQVDDNLIYANTTDGILVENSASGGGQIVNNTIYQISGNAVRLDSGAYNVLLRNNIIEVLAGYDISVAQGSETGFNSDFNDLYTGGASSASVGFWFSSSTSGVESTLSAWQAATGQEAHSESANPDFVNITGADGLLGYTDVNGVYADYGQDDNFELSAGSPAIDRGNSWIAPSTDILGSPRVDDPGTPNQGSPDYFAAPANPQPAYPSGGVAQNWNGVNTYFNYTLPFSFTFYGQSYTTVSVSTNGYLQFAGTDSPGTGSNPAAELLADARIAPLWASLETNQTGDNIYVDTSVANQVTFRWVATDTVDQSQANFAVTLYSNGNIQFYYGAGNINVTPTVGISAGNGWAYKLLSGYSGQTNLTSAASVLYTLKPGVVDLGAYEFQGSSLDLTPPSITSVTPAFVETGGTGFSFTGLQLTFSEPVNAIDADSTAVYQLDQAGSSGFGSPNDVIYPLTPQYNSTNNTVTLTVDGLNDGSLPAGDYELTVFSTATDTIHDLSGNALDGDDNGTAGGNFVRTFSLSGAQPVVTGVSPNAGPVSGGTLVTITGTNLSGVSAVEFGSKSVPVQSDTGTQITATSPAGSGGPVDILLVAPGGTSAKTPADQFTYLAAPAVSGIAPAAGPIAGGTTVTITGTNLLGASAVDFGTTAATIVTDTGTQLIVTDPMRAAGTVDVTVTTAGGVSAKSSADQFTYQSAPTVSSVSPGLGTTAGGTTVIITGTNLQGATAVDFGAVAAMITQDTGTQITATSPPGTAGARVDVTVTTPGGVSATSPDDLYTFITAPTVTGLSVSQGPIGGGTSVTVTGTNLAGGTVVVDFGTNPATISSDTGTQVVVTSPAGSVGAVDVTVTTAAGASMKSPADLFTYTALQVPTITWPAPADITYGTALSGTQLDATANVPGTFTYTPAAGTVLGAGPDQTLSVSFAPNDSTDYASASATVTINVKQAMPTITWANPADIVYGTALSGTQLDATANVQGTFTYSPVAGTVLGAGPDQTLSVNFVPTDSTDYADASATVMINVKQATPTITWANPADIVYGTALSGTQLDATANVQGTFTYSPVAGTVLGAGPDQTLSVSFAPNDSTDYTNTSATVTINVKQATPTITWANPADIVYGNALSGTQLDATANVQGTFTYSPVAGTIRGAGPDQTLSVSFAPNDTTDYTDASATVMINVKQATPTITWANPADIVKGTALSGTQLDATANVQGTFTYTPAAGTVLGAGPDQTLSVSFAPNDSTDYTNASATVMINVKAAAPTITWASPADIVYGTALSATQLDATANVQGTFTYTPAAGTVLGAGPDQTLSVSFAPNDSADYTNASATVTINVKQATPAITWANPADIVYGTALSGTQLDATANVQGTFTYTPVAGTVLGAGPDQTLSVSFAPNDSTDYTNASAAVTINVKQATPTITWANPTAIPDGTPLSSTQLDAKASWTLAGVVGSVLGTFNYSPPAGTVLGTGNNQTLSAVFTPTDSTDYTTASGSAQIDVFSTLSLSSLSTVSPNPRNSAVSSIQVTFNEPINTSSLTAGALTLTDNNGTDLITSAVTMSLVSGSTYQINGLSGLTMNNGEYTLSVSAADIDDQSGNPGSGTLSTSWLMDTTPPTSKVNPLPTRGTSLTFAVSVTGSDGGSPPSGVTSYDVYSSTNGGPWALWTTVPASNPTASFTGQSNTTYAFYSIAHDLAGNTEIKAPAIEASTYLPDLTPPATSVDGTTGTNPSSVDATTGTFTLNLTGSDPGGGVVTYFEVFVSVDSAPFKLAAPAIPAGPANSAGIVQASIPYQGLTDGAAHTYAFYSIGLDSAGNTQAAPVSPNLALTETFANATPAQLQATKLVVEDGAVERSYIRYLQVDFNESDSQSGGELTQIVNSLKTTSPEIQLYQYDLNDDASSKTAVSLSAVNVSVIDHAIELDFGANGLGGSPNTTTADGYYAISIKLPSGTTDVHNFYRLLGDVTGDGTVDNNDLNEIAAEINLSTPAGFIPLGADLNGDGVVSAVDLALATRAKGHKLKSGLSLG